MASNHAVGAENEAAEAQRLLRDLDHMIGYWEQQACSARNKKVVASYLKKKEKCRKMADEIIRGLEPSK